MNQFESTSCSSRCPNFGIGINSARFAASRMEFRPVQFRPDPKKPVICNSASGRVGARSGGLAIGVGVRPASDAKNASSLHVTRYGALLADGLRGVSTPRRAQPVSTRQQCASPRVTRRHRRRLAGAAWARGAVTALSLPTRAPAHALVVRAAASLGRWLCSTSRRRNRVEGKGSKQTQPAFVELESRAGRSKRCTCAPSAVLDAYTHRHCWSRAAIARRAS
jgi:hypothetical protein